jgi:hypothetical protein
MPLPDQTPRLPKWPFLTGDIGLLITAVLIASNASNPLTSTEIWSITVCVACAAAIGAIPFISDYARKQDEALDERQRSLASLARTITTSAEQISIAANGFHGISELAQNNLKQAEQLPLKLQEKIAESQVHAIHVAELGKKELDRLELITERVTKAAADYLKAEASVQKQISSALTLVDQLEAKINQLSENITKLNTEYVKPIIKVDQPKEPEVEVQKIEAPATQEKIEPNIIDQVSTPVGEEKNQTVSEVAEQPANETIPLVTDPHPELIEVNTVVAKPERKRAPKKQVEPVLEPEISSDSESEPKVIQEAPDLSLEFSDVTPDDQDTSTAVSADGATRIIATAYIGIGNRLFIRGDGPGLSWDKGIPLQFVSIGKWRWETMDAEKTITYKLYKNDEIESSNLNNPALEPGSQVELNVTF